jgi:hypothetical protein
MAMRNPEDRAVRLHRNPEQGWVDLILEAASPAEADRWLGAESEALGRLLDQDVTLHEALEVQRLTAELEALRADLRRTVELRRSPAPGAGPERRAG